MTALPRQKAVPAKDIKSGDDISASINAVCSAGKNMDQHIGQKADGNAGSNRKCQGHQNRHQHDRHGNSHVLPIWIARAVPENWQQQDQRWRGSEGRD